MQSPLGARESCIVKWLNDLLCLIMEANARGNLTDQYRHGVVVAFVGGVIARRIGLPTIIGYLLARIAIGPFTPGFVGDTTTISQLAELEGGLEMVRHTLLQLGFPLREIYRYTDAVRQDRYDLQLNTEIKHRLLHNLVDAVDGIEVTWMRLAPGNQIVGQTLAQANLRARTGASVVAILRYKQLLANPKSMTIFEADDRIGLIGDREQITAAQQLLEVAEGMDYNIPEIQSNQMNEEEER
jgi:hypothetical protein